LGLAASNPSIKMKAAGFSKALATRPGGRLQFFPWGFLLGGKGERTKPLLEPCLPVSWEELQPLKPQEKQLQ
jgi:hypothetical protein